MRKIFACILLIVAILLFAKLAFAQTATQSAGSVRLTFPIAQLGNCTSYQDCKTYCDDPTHTDACVAYAKEKGFYKEGNLDTNQTAVLAAAKTTLGCDSLDSCRTFCQQVANATACAAFAKAHNLQGGSSTVQSSVLQKAQQVLGCNSEDSCKTFCEQDANKTACANFAKDNNLHGGDTTVGPGGCSSESSCKTYCSDPIHFQVCSQFMDEKQASTSSHTNPPGHPAAMSATGEAHMSDRPQHPMPSEQQPVAGSSGENTPRPIFPTITQSVKAAATEKSIWQWLWDGLFPKW